MKKLNILFVSEYYHPRKAGGEVWAEELCSELVKMGHFVTVITLRFDESAREETHNGVRILRPFDTGKPYERMKRFFAAKKLVRYVKEFLKENHVDVIHTVTYTLNVPVSRLAQKNNIPCVTSIHTYFGKFWKQISPLWPLLQFLERRNLRCDLGKKHVPSQYLQELIKEDLGIETFVVHNWLPNKFPKPKKFSEKTFLFVGSLEPVKNPLACIPIAKKEKAKLVIIGSGSLKKKMKTKAEEEGIKYEFVGELSRKETLSYIGGADKVLIPSITESFSLVAIEALAQGTPIEGNKIGIMKELKTDSSSYDLNAKETSQIKKNFDKKKLVQDIEKIY